MDRTRQGTMQWKELLFPHSQRESSLWLAGCTCAHLEPAHIGSPSGEPPTEGSRKFSILSALRSCRSWAALFPRSLWWEVALLSEAAPGFPEGI